MSVYAFNLRIITEYILAMITENHLIYFRTENSFFRQSDGLNMMIASACLKKFTLSSLRHIYNSLSKNDLTKAYLLFFVRR